MSRLIGSVSCGLEKALALLFTEQIADVADRPPLIGPPREYEGAEFSKLLHDHFPNGYFAARGSSEGHIRALGKAGVGIGVLDCFVGDLDPGLTRVVPDPVWTQTAWAEVHIAMAKAARISAVTDFLRQVLAEEADLLAGEYSPSSHRHSRIGPAAQSAVSRPSARRPQDA